jgi:hypothetical protein
VNIPFKLNRADALQSTSAQAKPSLSAPSALCDGVMASFRVYGTVQSPGDEREAELHDIAVLGYN